MVEITAAYPAGKIDTTIENLKAAAAGEHEEYTVLYPEFARIAKEEGFPQVAAQFNLVSKAEAHHEQRYECFLKTWKTEVFKKAQPVTWICRECGYVHQGTDAPKTCPCCDHPQAFFQVLTDIY